MVAAFNEVVADTAVSTAYRIFPIPEQNFINRDNSHCSLNLRLCSLQTNGSKQALPATSYHLCNIPDHFQESILSRHDPIYEVPIPEEMPTTRTAWNSLTTRLANSDEGTSRAYYECVPCNRLLGSCLRSISGAMSTPTCSCEKNRMGDHCTKRPRSLQHFHSNQFSRSNLRF